MLEAHRVILYLAKPQGTISVHVCLHLRVRLRIEVVQPQTRLWKLAPLVLERPAVQTRHSPSTKSKFAKSTVSSRRFQVKKRVCLWSGLERSGSISKLTNLIGFSGQACDCLTQDLL